MNPIRHGIDLPGQEDFILDRDKAPDLDLPVYIIARGRELSDLPREVHKAFAERRAIWESSHVTE